MPTLLFVIFSLFTSHAAWACEADQPCKPRDISFSVEIGPEELDRPLPLVKENFYLLEGFFSAEEKERTPSLTYFPYRPTQGELIYQQDKLYWYPQPKAHPEEKFVIANRQSPEYRPELESKDEYTFEAFLDEGLRNHHEVKMRAVGPCKKHVENWVGGTTYFERAFKHRVLIPVDSERTLELVFAFGDVSRTYKTLAECQAE